ncbi:hydrolase [Ochromonadaceae sp. CCMP2298]|jgi:maleamate amidohydrolase|nr:hydrolase [Ochromonadaceae sp. CCMP2298]
MSKTPQDRDLAIGTLSLGLCPALIVVDLSNGFSDPASPLGGDFDSQILQINGLSQAFRTKKLPVFFTSVVYHDETTASVFRRRLPDLNILKTSSEWVKINRKINKKTDELIIEKQWPSAFFKTQLAAQLEKNAVDSIVVVGLTTSGCVRATVVDGLQHNFPVFVVPEACGDRNLSAHHASLHDMHAKYAVVIAAKELCAQILSL